MRQPSTVASIVRAGALDAPVLASLLSDTMGDPAWGERAIAQTLEHGGGVAHLAAGRAYGEVMPVGFSLARVVVDEAELLAIGVLAQARRAGLGQRLLEQTIAAAAAHGAQRIVLEVASENSAARALYRRVGFAPVGMRRNYGGARPGGGTDAEIFARDLSEPA
jgi:ribosomal-protein-alanine N-acetyltransferase